MEDLETIKEFLIESAENLARLDHEIVELEQNPTDAELVASIFRTIHTIKGTCGFLGFDVLTEISHAAESILSQVRDGKRRATKNLIDIVLQSVDAIKSILSVIEETSKEGPEHYEDLTRRLLAFAESNEAGEAFYVSADCDASFTPIADGEEDIASQSLKKTESATMILALPSIASPDPSNGQLRVSETCTDVPATPEEEPDTPVTKNKNTSVATDTTVRVDVSLLDKLMNLVGELVLARNQMLQFNNSLQDSTFAATSQRLNLITTELQESVMKTRMQPIGIVWSKLPRVVRDLSASLGKQIALIMDGAETELDRTIVEAIKDPLTHIVRNSCDHGIETPAERVANGKAASGRLSLRAFHEGGHVNIEISDDGAGLNPDKIKNKAVHKGLISAEQAARMTDREAIQQIFLPGFSTAEKVSNISGRGVGMDVVKTNIEKIGGSVDLTSTMGAGMTVKIKIPLTLAIIPGLVVSIGSNRFVIPQISLLELIRLEGDSAKQQIERVQEGLLYRRRGKLLPLAFLHEVLQIQSEKVNRDVLNIIVLQAEDRQFGLIVDGINDTQEIVVKPLGKQLKSLTTYSGATIMGDGRVALILDVPGVANCSSVLGKSTGIASVASAGENVAPEANQQALLLFRAGGHKRVAIPLELVARLEEISIDQIESAAGKLVVQYRTRILPLISLSGTIDSYGIQQYAVDGKVQVIVFNSGEKMIGLVVEQVIDVVHEVVAVRLEAQRRGIIGSAVVGQKMTDFVDLPSIVKDAGETWFDQSPKLGLRGPILIFDSSGFTRALTRNKLLMAGFVVREAANTEEALAVLDAVKIEAIVASADFARACATIKQNHAFSALPVYGLVQDGRVNEECHPDRSFHFDEYHSVFEGDSLVNSLRRLSRAVELGLAGNKEVLCQ